MADRSNLLTNPSFQYGFTDWNPIGGADLTIRPGLAFYGDQCVKVDVSNVLNVSGIEYRKLIPVTPGRKYAALAHVQVPAVVPPVQDAKVVIRIGWYTSTGDELENSFGLPVYNDSTEVTVHERDGWVRLSNLVTPPIGATFAEYQVLQKTPPNILDPFTGLPTAISYFFLDACLFEEATSVGGYIDTFAIEDKTWAIQQGLTPYQKSAVETIPLRADVVLNNLILNTIDEDNVVWVCTDIDGWWGHSTPDGPNIERGFEDGSYDVAGRYQARSLSLTGVFLPPDPSAMPKARDRLIAATNIIRDGAWLRTSENPTRASFVRLAGRPKIATTNARGRTEFEIPLRAADPTKYHWNDTDPNGVSSIMIPSNLGTGKVTNLGTSDVRAKFRLTGPMGPESSIYNETTDERITLTRPIRRAGAIATVSQKERALGIATLTTHGDSGLYDGDRITVTNVGSPYDSPSGTYFTILNATREEPFQVTYSLVSTSTTARATEAITDSGGTIGLFQDDELEIDTYQKSVTFNKIGTGQRSRLETMVDWIKLVPGDNYISLDTALTHIKVNKKVASGGKVTLTTTTGHQLTANETIVVKFPTDADMSGKALANNVATIETGKPHGFAVKDSVAITSISSAILAHKNVVASTGRVTMKTLEVPGVDVWDFQNGDVITIDLPVDANIIKKAYDGEYVTITTDKASHGFMGASPGNAGDLVTVNLPTTATIAQKEVYQGFGIITFTGSHNFSVGDYIYIDLPYYTTTASAKSIVGTTATLTTATAHNFSNGDTVTIALPGAALLAGDAIYSGGPNYTVTLTTSTAHGFEVGDIIDVDIATDVQANADLYNGRTIVQSKTATTLTYTKYDADTGITVAVGAGAKVTNATNSALNGSHRLTATPSTTQLSYSVVAI